MLQELRMRKNYLSNPHIATVYWGGGTPSLLPLTSLEEQLRMVQTEFELSEDAEITLEANPDDLTEENLKGWRKLGINRLSIGVQSFFDEDLQWMNRAHTASQSADGLRRALTFFDNISVDFIYGSSGLTDERWQQNIAQALELGIPHLSCYALTVEPKTALEYQIAKKEKADIDPEAQARQYLLLLNWLEEAGYEAYEISNFALPGKRSRHNSSYWKGVPYLGIGPSAHSYNGNQRQWNLANNALYIQAIEKGLPASEMENLGRKQRINEHLMIRLRMMEGLDLMEYKTIFGDQEAERVFQGLQTFIEQDWVLWNGQYAQLSRDGKLMADGIAAALFSEEE
jgi:oxygen-independent coproporphyrinogen-3 oxidase